MTVHTLPDPHWRLHLLKTDWTLKLCFPEGGIYLNVGAFILSALLVDQHLLQELVHLVQRIQLIIMLLLEKVKAQTKELDRCD